MAEAIAKEFPSAVTELESTAGTDASPVKVTVVRPPTTPDGAGQPQAVPQHPPRRGPRSPARPRRRPGPRDARQDDQDPGRHQGGHRPAPPRGRSPHDADAAKRPLIVEVDPRSPRAEAFRSLRTNLQFVDAANHPRTIVVTSSLAGEGKSTMTANLALTMAQAGSRVCLIEADLRRPKVLDYLGLEGGVGLTDALIGRTDVVRRPPALRRHQPLGAGRRVRSRPTRPSCSARPRCGACSPPSTARFDYIVIDAPPTLPVTDAVVISKPGRRRRSSWSGRASSSATSWSARWRTSSRSAAACSGSCSTGCPAKFGQQLRRLRLRGPGGGGDAPGAQAGGAGLRPDAVTRGLNRRR